MPLHSITSFVCETANSAWETFPFSRSAYDGGIWISIARMAFVLLLLVGVAFLLRYLFGPGGPLREDGFETMEEAKARRELEERGEKGVSGAESRTEHKESK